MVCFRVVIPLCGGNIDTTILGRCLDRGLAADGRLVKFTVTVSDRPGGIGELAKALADMGVSIKDMMHERAWIKNDIFCVEVSRLDVLPFLCFVLSSFVLCLQCVPLLAVALKVLVMAETRDAKHAREMKEMLQSKYTQLSITGVGEALGIDQENEKANEIKGYNFSHLQPLPEDESLPNTPGKTSRSGSILIDDQVLQFGGLSVPVITSARRGSIRQAVGTFTTTE